MKRKIALLLAVLMTVALLPAQLVSAAPQAKYNQEYFGIPSQGNTIYIEDRLVVAGQTITMTNYATRGDDNPKYARMAPEIGVYVDEVTKGDVFEITLTGAKFATATPTWWSYRSPLFNPWWGSWVAPAGGTFGNAGYYFRKGTYDADLTPANFPNSLLVSGQRNPRLGAAGGGPMYSSSLNSWVNQNEENARLGISNSTAGPNVNPVGGDPNGLYKGFAQLAYSMEITGEYTARVTVLQNAYRGSLSNGLIDGYGVYTEQAVMLIPVPIYTENQNTTVSAHLRYPVGNTGNITTAFSLTASVPLLQAAGAGGVTITSSPLLADSNDNRSNYELFPMHQITITETTPRSIKQSSGTFSITTRDGFEFLSPVNYRTDINSLPLPDRTTTWQWNRQPSGGSHMIGASSDSNRRYPAPYYAGYAPNTGMLGFIPNTGWYMGMVWSEGAVAVDYVPGSLGTNASGQSTISTAAVTPSASGAYVPWDDLLVLISKNRADALGLPAITTNGGAYTGADLNGLTDLQIANLSISARDWLHTNFFGTLSDNIYNSTLNTYLWDLINTIRWNTDFLNNRSTPNTGRYYLTLGNNGGNLVADVGGGFYPSPNVKVDYMWFELNRNGEIDFRKVFIEYSGLNTSSGVPGVLRLTNCPLLVRADENALMGDVLVDFGTVSDCGISQSGVKIGERLAYGIAFNATTSPLPTLYSGQYETNADNSSFADTWHKVSTMTFKENVANSWNANKQTIFRFPKEVKIGAIKLSTQSNHFEELASWNSWQYVYSPYNAPKRPYDYQARFVSDLMEGYISIQNNAESNEQFNDIILSGITEKQTWDNFRANFTLEVWVSVESGYEGPIDVELTGTAIVSDVTTSPLTVANVLNPIKVVPDAITPLKVGYQTQSAADFEVIENKAGILRKNDTLRLSLTDDVNVSDMSFVNAKYAVTNGNIQFKNYRVAGYADSKAISPFLGQNVGGTISMDVAVASGVASTIRFSDVQVKIDRSAPESNTLANTQIGYNIVAWGNAVAPNFDATEKPRPATFTTPGIKVKYLTVGTLGSGGAMNNKVRVPIGESYIEINGQKYDMDASAYIDADTERTMIPIRYAALALMDDPAILSSRTDGFESETMPLSWDDATHTVTLFANTVGGTPSVVQFTDGSDFMLVNGVQVPLEAKAKINPEDSRMYIPFRALGYAFNIPVDFQDGDDGKFATFN